MLSAGRRRVPVRNTRTKTGKPKPAVSLSSLAEKMRETGVQPSKNWQDAVEERADALLDQRQQ